MGKLLMLYILNISFAPIGKLFLHITHNIKTCYILHIILLMIRFTVSFLLAKLTEFI